MNEEKYKKLFDFIYKDFIRAHHYVHTLKALREKEYDIFFLRWKYLWSAILDSLQVNSLRSLANIYEESGSTKKGETVSVFTLLKWQIDVKRASEATDILKENSDLIRRIKNYRDKFLAHNDIKQVLTPELEEIRYEEVEKLTAVSGKLLNLLNPVEGVGYRFDNFEEQPTFDARAMFDALRYHKQKQDKWMIKFQNRETDTLRMPDDF
jgi:hypothetical protein